MGIIYIIFDNCQGYIYTHLIVIRLKHIIYDMVYIVEDIERLKENWADIFDIWRNKSEGKNNLR